MSYECIWTDKNSMNSKLKPGTTELRRENDFLLSDIKHVTSENNSNEILQEETDLNHAPREDGHEFVLTDVKYINTEDEETDVLLEETRTVDCNGKRGKRQSNLDKYFHDLYENELVFQIDHEEIELIQTGVETLVKELIRVIKLEESEAIRKETIKVKAAFNYLHSIEEDDQGDEDDAILKVGSFYEGSQNEFPNDFDFIFLLGSFRSDRITRSIVHYEDARYEVLYDLHYRDRDNYVHNAIRAVSSRIRSIYFMEDNREKMTADEETINLGDMEGFRSVVFDEYVIIDEKASKLRFIYQNEFGVVTYINVNIIPAFMVFEAPGLRENDDMCKSPFVSTEVARTGSVLIVAGLVWFSQTEVAFLRTILSKRHLKVFRIVKHLIGGRRQTDAIYERLVETGLWRYNTGIMTSYMVKVAVIFHHYNCKHSDNAPEAPCVLEILTFLKDIKSNKNIQLLTDVEHTPNFFRCEVRYNRLRDMIEQFQSMQRSRKPYSCEACKVVPINQALLDCFGTRVFRRALPQNRQGAPLNKRRQSGMVAYCPTVINYLMIIALVLYLLVTFHLLTGYFGEPYP